MNRKEKEIMELYERLYSIFSSDELETLKINVIDNYEQDKLAKSFSDDIVSSNLTVRIFDGKIVITQN
jgi:hypothetical protein